jgi:hypothetical protein
MALQRLKQLLEGRTRSSLSRIDTADFSDLEKEARKLRRWIGSSTGSDKPPNDRIVAAMRRFSLSGTLDGVAQAKLVCFGCTQSFGTNRYRIIEQKKLFVALLEYVDQYHRKPRLFRRCYRGLLNGYFSYDPHAPDASSDGLSSWDALRKFLDRRKDCIQTPTAPDWVSALSDHANLLGGEPSKRYGLAALHGDRSAFDALRQRLGITDDSWLIRSLVGAQIDAAVGLTEENFKFALHPLLDLLNEHQLVRDNNLVKLINRYADCTRKDVHARLRDFAVTHWRNPWLPTNEARWGLVRTDAREMIAGWLKLQLIGQFFALLAEDGANDTRRLEFWRHYHDQIEDMYFALGRSATHNNSPDFKAIRKAMEGRLLSLYAAGTNSNNAFIMMIRDYAIVEFGTVGNAAFIFKRKELPFVLKGAVAGNDTQLKNWSHAGYVTRLVHRDTSYGSWEREFAAVLSRRVGAETPHFERSATRRSVHSDQAGTGSPTRLTSATPFSVEALAKFTNEHGLVIHDLRAKGGNLWLSMARGLSEEARKTLELWDFRWSDKRRAFFRQE